MRLGKRLHGCVSLGALMIVMGAANAARAQTGASAAQAMAPAAQSDASGFQDIVVTARKRDERLQDVPVAITAFTAAELSRYGTQSLTQVAAQTPSLVAGISNNTTAGGNIVLRGVGSPATGPAIDQAVSVNIDGVQISKAYALRLGVYDLSRIEVLKGPQALFFGKNSPGGIISLVSSDPGDSLEAMVRGGYEFYAHKKFVEAMISSPITDSLGVRIDGSFTDDRGWFINTAAPTPAVAIPAALGGGFTAPGIGTTHKYGPTSKNYFVRGTLAFSPSDAFDAKLKVAYNQFDQWGGLGFNNQLVACSLGQPYYGVLLNIPASRDCKLDRYTNAADFPASVANLNPLQRDGRLFINNKQLLGSLQMNFKASDQISLSSVTGYWKMKEQYLGNFSFNSQAYLNGATQIEDEQVSQELRASTKFDFPVNVVLGAYYQHETVDMNFVTASDSLYTSLFTGFFAPPGPVVLISNQSQQKTRAWSVFGQAIANISSQVQFTAGARYSREKKQVRAFIPPNIFTATGYQAILTPDERSFSNFSPEFALTYKPANNVTLFASYRYGFKSGGFDISSSTGAFGSPNAGDISYDQEKVKGGEIGIKGTFLDRQLQIDLSAYSFKYTGLQVASFDPRVVAFKVTNSGSARVKGIDLSAQLRPNQIDGLTLRSAIAYNSAKYIQFDTAPCYAGQSQALGCNLIVSSANGQRIVTPAGPSDVANAQDLAGRPLSRAPKWSLNFGATQLVKLPNDMSLSLAVDERYTSEYWAMAEQDPRSLAKEVWKLDASIALRGRDDRWELALIGTNLTNKLRQLSTISYAGTPLVPGTGTPVGTLGDLQGEPTEPRAVTLQATIKF